jgi:glutamine cyclotransferase
VRTIIGQFTYPTEGWGLTYDGTHLIMSDGTAQLYFLDPTTLAVEKQLTVSIFDTNDQSRKDMVRLNELEYIEGEIFANIWQTDAIVRIDPANGYVTGVIDLTGLLPAEERTATTDVLNGIAYLPEGKRLFVTGKKWPKLFEIQLVQQ